jgi:hypothetical protein
MALEHLEFEHWRRTALNSRRGLAAIQVLGLILATALLITASLLVVVGAAATILR